MFLKKDKFCSKILSFKFDILYYREYKLLSIKFYSYEYLFDIVNIRRDSQTAVFCFTHKLQVVYMNRAIYHNK